MLTAGPLNGASLLVGISDFAILELQGLLVHGIPDIPIPDNADG
jgi:hypothetical protein